MKQGKVWEFKTENFRVSLELEQEHGYKYDGDDEDGSIQQKIDDGDYVVFTSCVTVYLHGSEIGVSYLGDSVYADDDTLDQFWKGHRDPNPENRNCSFNNYRVGHYFPDMVKEAISEARKHLANLPKMRTVL